VARIVSSVAFSDQERGLEQFFCSTSLIWMRRTFIKYLNCGWQISTRWNTILLSNILPLKNSTSRTQDIKLAHVYRPTGGGNCCDEMITSVTCASRPITWPVAWLPRYGLAASINHLPNLHANVNTF
jgi:hypothetical protein